MTKIFGITGGMGSGKSTLSRNLTKKGFRVHDSDKEVSNIYKKPSKSFIELLIKIGFEKSLSKKGINKKIIAKEIFLNAKKKQLLEKFIFKIVRKKRLDFIRKETTKKTKIIFADVPLLFENNLEKNFDKIICIIASQKTRYKRLKKTKNISEKFFRLVIKSQTTDIIRKKRSDIIIYNNQSMKQYTTKINKFIESLKDERSSN